MKPPSDQFRDYVAGRSEDWAASNLTDDVHEQYLEVLLDEIDAEMSQSATEINGREELTRTRPRSSSRRSTHGPP